MPTALLSAHDKSGLVFFTTWLRSLGYNLLGLAGMAKHLNEHGIPAFDLTEIVGPPMLGHKVVTLSRVHAALLADDSPEDQAELARIGMPRIDLVYVSLYPLGEEVTKRGGCTLVSVTEKTDIDGIMLLLWAAKGRRLVLHSHKQFPEVLEYLRDQQQLSRPPVRGHEHERFVSSLVGQATGAVVQHLRVAANYHWDFAELGDKAVREG